MASDILGRYPTATAGELTRALVAGEVSAVDLATAAIERIEALDPAINAVVVRDFERGLAAAAAADARLRRGERAPLLGVPMTVKESFNVAGLPTTWGVAAFKGWTAEDDAVVVRRLKGAGAVILGKTNVPPHLADWQSDNPVYGRTNHPLDPALTPGGSSGGAAAALAAGMVPLEFGSDIGGSIRVPAGFCGVWGHKPTYGLVPSRGQSPPGTDGVPPRLAVVGPLARAPEDLETVLDVVAGPDDDEAIAYSLHLPPPRHEAIADFRVLVIDSHPVAAVDSEIASALESAAQAAGEAGAKVERGGDLLPDLALAHQVYATLLFTEIMRGAPQQGDAITAHAWMDAADAQLAIRRQWRRLFHAFDAVLAPIMGVVAFPHDQSEFNSRIHVINGEETPYPAQVAWPGIATLANLPATAVPWGKTGAGLPVGLQIIGPHLEDRTPLALAKLMRGLGT